MLFWAIIGLKYRAVYIGGKEMIGKMVRDEKIDKKMQVFSSSNAFLVQLKTRPDAASLTCCFLHTVYRITLLAHTYLMLSVKVTTNILTKLLYTYTFAGFSVEYCLANWQVRRLHLAIHGIFILLDFGIMRASQYTNLNV